MPYDPDTLQTRWEALLDDEPHTRIRNAAAALGVAEAQLLATRCGDGVTRLDGPFGTLLTEVEPLGQVMALTRNAGAVHEKTGVYHNVKLMESHAMGLVLDDDIDLRLFLSNWHLGFAVTTESSAGPRHSLQFFDEAGTAVHKIFLTRKSDKAAYDALVTRYRHRNQSTAQPVAHPTPRDPETPDEAIDQEAFLEEWAALRDTHDFFPLLKEHAVGRQQALRLAEGRFTRRVPADALRQTLTAAAEREAPIMIFVGNRGCLQIHTGPVRMLKPTPPWFNVLDPGFQLHLNEEHIASAWVVEKPTRDGTVTSLELLDADGEVLALLFGKRKPGLPERDDWRAIIRSLETAGEAVGA